MDKAPRDSLRQLGEATTDGKPREKGDPERLSEDKAEDDSHWPARRPRLADARGIGRYREQEKDARGTERGPAHLIRVEDCDHEDGADVINDRQCRQKDLPSDHH